MLDYGSSNSWRLRQSGETGPWSKLNWSCLKIYPKSNSPAFLKGEEITVVTSCRETFSQRHFRITWLFDAEVAFTNVGSLTFSSEIDEINGSKTLYKPLCDLASLVFATIIADIGCLVDLNAVNGVGETVYLTHKRKSYQHVLFL